MRTAEGVCWDVETFHLHIFSTEVGIKHHIFVLVDVQGGPRGRFSSISVFLFFNLC